eukprot:c5419_g1_i1.p1 GENE.c5419_g1_i1~~c5419_g1_i1.p1  ORF type:complete len:287 (+),score=54.26 c5419_g1_i1:107-967(+)
MLEGGTIIGTLGDEWSSRIVEVWEHNLDEQMGLIRNIIDDYPYISMDTEFPGVVARPLGTFKNNAEYNYHTLRCNVDLLNIIQLGMTFSDGEGNLCPGTCTWQFNFKFSLSSDMYSPTSIELLTTNGVDFDKHNKHGISRQAFSELLMVSGVVLNEAVYWITFHAGYDFAYLLKLLTCSPLPTTEQKFSQLLLLYFPNMYDIKFMMKDCENLRGGLQRIADDLQVERVGQMHNAGSDSLLTHSTFFKILKDFAHLDTQKYVNVLYGLGQGCFSNMEHSQLFAATTS